MSAVCIIPARGGSKRIARKNIKPFCGQPMLAYSIQAALASHCFDRVVVSTDDDEIATLGRIAQRVRMGELAREESLAQGSHRRRRA